MNIVKAKAIIGRVLGYVEPLPLLTSPDYVLESKQILAEIARVHRPIRARNSTTLRCVIEHLHYDYKFKSYVRGRILVFENMLEVREARDCVNRMDAYTRKGFEFIVVSPTVLLSRVSGTHYL
jgi:hypothetical protein